MISSRRAGYLLMGSVIAILVPYTILTLTFDYPDVLRKQPGIILENFNQGGTALILTWFAFALSGIPLYLAYLSVGEKIEKQLPQFRWITNLALVSVLLQMVGLLRWVFIVPVLATDFVNSDSLADKELVVIVFKAFHQFLGVVLGEHLGQLLTVIWTFFFVRAALKLNHIPKWLAVFGYYAAAIYGLGQSELIATSIPSFPVVPFAGFVGSTLWLIWLFLLGFKFQKSPSINSIHYQNLKYS